MRVVDGVAAAGRHSPRRGSRPESVRRGLVGQLLQGEENAKEGLVVWSAESLAPSKLTMYAAGFSGETATVNLPNSTDKAVLRKTYRVDYTVSGELRRLSHSGDGAEAKATGLQYL